MPQEIEVWYVIPAIRRELAKAMAKKGMKQKDIAKNLSLTEPAVSQYIRAKRAKEVDFDAEYTIIIQNAAERIIKNNGVMVMEIQTLCDKIRKNGLLCKIARKYHKTPKDCCVCMRAGI